MSYGFIRKQSPAARSAAQTAANARRYGLLRKLQVEEVSSVDHGANPGARVVFFKSAEDEMDILKSLDSPADRLADAIINKRIGSCEAWDAMCKIADQHYTPGKKLEASRQAFFDNNPLGIKLMKAYRAMPLDSFDKRLTHVLKAAAVPAPHRAGSDNEDEDEDDNGGLPEGTNPYHAVIELMADKLMQSPEGKNMSKERAYDHLVRHNPTAMKLFQLATHHDLTRPQNRTA